MSVGKSNAPKVAPVHQVFATLNSLRNPRLAAIYLSLLAAEKSQEEGARASQRAAGDEIKSE